MSETVSITAFGAGGGVTGSAALAAVAAWLRARAVTAVGVGGVWVRADLAEVFGSVPFTSLGASASGATLDLLVLRAVVAGLRAAVLEVVRVGMLPF
ncbi:MAG: hypothetical protein M3Q89_10845 [Verrucomicrobiota bacterium]|nr:hypothetical protein [Verrucomicrobiota bacterium]